MDGHFVPNLTIGPPIVRWLRPVTEATFDVHLMIENPDQFIADFAAAGANWISVHQEACVHLNRTLTLIKEHGCQPGVVINPATPVETLTEVLDMVNLVLVMSVNPGFGGQSFIPRSESKVREVRTLLDRSGNTAAPIEIDGGIDLNTAPRVVAAGARILVAGNAIFGTSDPERATRELKARAMAGLTVAPTR